MGRSIIPIEIKKTCVELSKEGTPTVEIYNNYFKRQFDYPQSYKSFTASLAKWKRVPFPEVDTLEAGTYDGFIAHDATVQISKTGEIVQAWIKQKPGEIDTEEFLLALKERVDPYVYTVTSDEHASCMLEIPLFDMHWGVAFMDDYKNVLDEVLAIIHRQNWDKIVIPFGQDFFHNDSIANGVTTKGTVIEKVDMIRAVKEGREFMYAIIDAAISKANKVEVIYSPGNHDRSISWMFVQVLLERYGPSIVDDSLAFRKVVTYGKNAILITHGDSKRATAKNLTHVFAIAFPEEFANANVREVHSGHLHHESEADIYGVMVRRLSSGVVTDEWSDKEDLIGRHERFMLFEWGLDKLKSIHYI